MLPACAWSRLRARSGRCSCAGALRSRVQRLPSLAEAFSRLDHLRSDARFEQAKAMPSGEERTKVFAAVDEA